MGEDKGTQMRRRSREFGWGQWKLSGGIVGVVGELGEDRGMDRGIGAGSRVGRF